MNERSNFEDTSVDSNADTTPVRTLSELADAGKEPGGPDAGYDPYRNQTAVPTRAKPRRTLDDMRRLSEQIKSARARKRTR